MGRKIIIVKSDAKWQATAIIGECLRGNSCNGMKIISYKRNSCIGKAIKKAISLKLGRGFSNIHCYLFEDRIATLVRMASDIKVVTCLDEDAVKKILDGETAPDVAAARSLLDKHMQSFDKVDAVEEFLKGRFGPNYDFMGAAENASSLRSRIYQSYKETELSYIDALTKAVIPLI